MTHLVEIEYWDEFEYFIVGSINPQDIPDKIHDRIRSNSHQLKSGASLFYNPDMINDPAFVIEVVQGPRFI